MATITLICEEMVVDLKDGLATMLRLPELNVHVMIHRHRDMVMIKNLEKAPLYVEQEDFVACMLDEVLQKATVHNDAKIYYQCKKIAGVWSKDPNNDFIRIVYTKEPTTEPPAPKNPPSKRKYCAEVYEEEREGEGPAASRTKIEDF
jgi:hypothetical protein